MANWKSKRFSVLFLSFIIINSINSFNLMEKLCGLSNGKWFRIWWNINKNNLFWPFGILAPRKVFSRYILIMTLDEKNAATCRIDKNVLHRVQNTIFFSKVIMQFGHFSSFSFGMTINMCEIYDFIKSAPRKFSWFSNVRYSFIFYKIPFSKKVEQQQH